jgi:hypothetical protein
MNVDTPPRRVLVIAQVEWQTSARQHWQQQFEIAPKQGDFHLQKDSPALPLGFVPWDYDQAGLIGEPEWTERAESEQ